MISPAQAIVSVVARRTWLVAVVAVIACSGFTARAVAALLAVDVDAAADARPPARPVARVGPIEAPVVKVRDGKIIVERNIFCSSCTPSVTEVGVSSGYRGEPALLIATELGREPRATVRVIATEVAGSWGLGAVIPAVGKIDRIGPTSIDVIDEHGARGRLSLLDLTAAGGGRTGAATPGPAPAAGPYADSVNKLSEGVFEVRRELVRELVTGAAKPNGTTAVPYMVKGKVAGIRIARVAKDSIGTALELHPGDILSAIDGVPIENVQQLLDLYAKLDDVASVDITGKRGSKPLSLSLRLR